MFFLYIFPNIGFQSGSGGGSELKVLKNVKVLNIQKTKKQKRNQ